MKKIISPVPTSKDRMASILPRKMTQTAPAAAMIRPASTPGRVFWPRTGSAKAALRSGMRVKTAPVATGLVNSSAMNMVSM